MKIFITSCGRPDLLNYTLSSLKKDYLFMPVTVHEDSNPVILPYIDTMKYIDSLIETRGMGQHKSIEHFLSNNNDKYYFHCEDDWLFNNYYDFISISRQIMENDNSIIKVVARYQSPHPCTHNIKFNDVLNYGILEPWNNDNIDWYGFTWNPGLTRLDLLKQFIPFPKWEQELSKNIHDAGYKICELSIPVYDHIGWNRSTHQ